MMVLPLASLSWQSSKPTGLVVLAIVEAADDMYGLVADRDRLGGIGEAARDVDVVVVAGVDQRSIDRGLDGRVAAAEAGADRKHRGRGHQVGEQNQRQQCDPRQARDDGTGHGGSSMRAGWRVRGTPSGRI